MASHEEDIDSVDPASKRAGARALRTNGKAAEAARLERQTDDTLARLPEHAAAAQALRVGNAPAGCAILDRLLAVDPDDVLALTMLGRNAAATGDFERAEPLLRRAVDLSPDEVSARSAFAEMLVRSRRPSEALRQIDAIAAGPLADESVQSLRAEALSALGRLEEELAIIQPLAARGGPSNIGYALRTGHALRMLGRDSEAEAIYRSIVTLYPAEGTSWWSLANLKTIRFDDGDLATMEQALTVPRMPVRNRIRLNFALAKGHEERRDAAAAFTYYAEGNRLRASIAPYDEAMIGAWVDRCVKSFTPGLFGARAGQGAIQGDPIFIVGMQRSGSTLVEQILASHPAIEGTAELTDIPTLVRALGEDAARAGQSFEAHLAGLPAERLRGLGENYLASSRAHRRTDRPFFTDKMPNNWMHLGLIRLILPNAKIVDVRRDPLACCFSNWKQLYAQGLDHSNALDTMGRYYADYVRLMRHFDDVQPGMVHRIIYNDLVDDVEAGVRALLHHLEVPFDPACLDFHSNRRAVRTISAGQVRRPINRDGMDQWMPYDQWLGPLRDGLGDALETWRG